MIKGPLTHKKKVVESFENLEKLMKSTFREHCFSLSRRFQNGDFCIFVRRGFLIFRSNFVNKCAELPNILNSKTHGLDIFLKRAYFCEKCALFILY